MSLKAGSARALPAPSELRCTTFKEKLARGNEVIVAMDACKKNIETVQCGQDYIVRYWNDGQKWCHTVTGPRVSDDATITCRSIVKEAQWNVVSIFDTLFSVNDKGEIYYSGSGKPMLVGQLIDVLEGDRRPNSGRVCTAAVCTDFQ